MVSLLHWNARSLGANAQEFRTFIEEMTILPDKVSVQETHLKPNLDFRISNNSAVRCDGVTVCTTFIMGKVPFKVVEKGEEYIVVEV